jgi:pimeloyl-ACP methyl ester carboxylesterase
MVQRTAPQHPLGRASDPSLHLPRILCLHGGGTCARIFRAQCRVLRARLASSFRLVFADAPFPCQPGPDVESVYAAWGPFRSWLPPAPGGGFATSLDAVDGAAAAKQINQCIEKAMREDNDAGATGPWVGLLGFSQGAKMAASLLWRQQQLNLNRLQRRMLEGWEDWGADMDQYRGGSWHLQDQHYLLAGLRDSDANWARQTTDYRFAVLLAGRGPLVSMHSDMKGPDVLCLPTIHVHGLRDAGLAMHRDLLYRYCEGGSAKLVEWDGDHRVPIKTADVEAVVAEILQVARATGLVCHDYRE